jgi:undecaprenyl-diphosphatase
MTAAAPAGWLPVVLLALIQGLTEFLPISSSGHLVLAEKALGVAEPGVALEVILHLGTLGAVLLYYRRDWLDLAGAVLRFPARRSRPDDPRSLRLLGLLVLGTLPAACGGLLVGDRIEAAFQDPRFASAALVGTGLLLLATRLAGRGKRAVDARRALVIGFFQLLALFPGISRSGSTISGGLFFGVRPEEAARFSFLLSVPAILGAAVLKSGELSAGMRGGEAGRYLVGLVLAFASGDLAIGWLLRIVRRGRFAYFGVYCIALGITGWLLLTLR